MRITLTLEDDVAEAIRERRRKGAGSLKQIVNSLLRAGLRAESKPPPARAYRTQPQALHLRTGLDSRRLDQLADELETDAWRERQRKFSRDPS